jgi:hypothetical protein
MVWNFGGYHATLQLDDDGKTMAGKNEHGERLLTLASATTQPQHANLIGPAATLKSVSGMTAEYRHIVSLQSGYNYWNQSRFQAEQALLLDLDESYKSAIRAERLDEAVILERLRKESEKRLNKFSDQTAALIGIHGPAAWHHDATGVNFKFAPNGTLVQIPEKSRRGIWTVEGQTLILTWSDSHVIESYALELPATVFHGMNNRAEKVSVSLVEPTTQMASQIAATQPAASLTRLSPTQP